MYNNSKLKKSSKFLTLLLSSFLVMGGSLFTTFSNENNIVIDESKRDIVETKKENNESNTYRATFYVEGEVYSVVEYTKDNYMDKEAPSLPTPKPGHINYWYPQVDFSIFEDTYYDLMESLEFKVKSGSIKYENASFVSTKDNALAVHHNKVLSNGVISLDLNKVVGGDSGIVFGVTYHNEEPQAFWEVEGVSYYFLYHSNANNLVLSKITNGKYKTLVSVPSSSAANMNLQVSIDDNFIQCIVNNACLIKYEDQEKLTGNGIGFRLGKTGTSVSNFSTSHEPLKELEDVVGYFVASGRATADETKVNLLDNNTLVYSKRNPIYNREYQALIKPTNSTKVGFVFGLDTKNETEFFEDKVSYFRYVINETGKLVLEHVNNGNVTTLFDKYQLMNYAPANTYHLSIGFIGNKVNCYLNQNLIYTYNASSTFYQTYHGFTSSIGGATITKLGGAY